MCTVRIVPLTNWTLQAIIPAAVGQPLDQLRLRQHAGVFQWWTVRLGAVDERADVSEGKIIDWRVRILNNNYRQIDHDSGVVRVHVIEFMIVLTMTSRTVHADARPVSWSRSLLFIFMREPLNDLNVLVHVHWNECTVQWWAHFLKDINMLISIKIFHVSSLLRYRTETA